MKNTILLGALALGTVLLSRRLNRQAYDLRGKVALITGSSRGLGLELARQLAREGAKLAILARDAAELRRAEEELADSGADVLALVCDVADGDQVVTTVRRVVEHYGRLDVLINNAGIISVGPLETMIREDYERVMDINFWGVLNFLLATRDIMKAQGSGRIVNISSIGGIVAVPHLAPYTASKFAVRGLSEAWRAELLKDGILVTTVYPNLMRTGSPRNAEFKGQHEQEYTWFALSDNLPGLSQSAEQAAREIIEALKAGQAQLITGIPAKILSAVYRIWPAQVNNVAGIANRLLPGRGGIGTQSRKGHESETPLTRGFPVKENAEVAFNQR